MLRVNAESSVSLVDSTLEFGAVPGNGGCAFVEDGGFLSFSGNSLGLFCEAGGDGGVVYVQPDNPEIGTRTSEVLVEGRSALGFSGATNGGVIATYGGLLTVRDDGVLGDARASGDGGAVFLSAAAELVMRGSASAQQCLSGFGGGVFARDSATVTLYDDAAIQLNEAQLHGGGIAAVGASVVTLSGGTVLDNTTPGDGGGVLVDRTGSLQMSAGSIEGNAAFTGGGVAVTLARYPVAFGGGGSSASITGGLIAENTAVYAGGGAAVVDPQCDLAIGGDASVARNGAGALGGGVYLDGWASAELGGAAHIEENVSALYGGGVWGSAVFDFQLALTDDLVVRGNTAGVNGGGIGALGMGLNLDGRVMVEGNSAGQDGGGVWLGTFDLAVVLRDEVTVLGNVASRDGGGVHAGSLEMYGRSAIMNNDATWNGGGVYSEDVTLGGEPWFRTVPGLFVQDDDRGVAIQGNSAGQGGGIYLTDGALTGAYAVIQDNTADELGGGIYAESAAIELSNSLVLLNSAPAGGGLMLVESDVDFDSEFAGSAPCAPLVAPEWEDRYCAEISGNVADGDVGGGFMLRGAGTSRLLGVALWENQALAGGAAMALLDLGPGSSPTLTANQVLLAGNGVTGAGAEQSAITVRDTATLRLRHATAADDLDVIYGPAARGVVRNSIVWGGSPGLGQLDLQTTIGGSCNVGNLIGPSGLGPAGVNNDDGLDPMFTSTASNPTVHPRGLYHIDGSAVAMDQCAHDGDVDLDGNARPDGTGLPGSFRFDRGAFEVPVGP